MGLIRSLWDALIFSFYRWMAMPVALIILKIIRPALSAKLQEMISDRDNLNLQVLPARPIWIHASSGEIEYAKSVIREIKRAYPQIPVIVTYFSPSAKKLIQKFSGIDLAMALPWDHQSAVRKFLDFYRPRAFLIARTDVWPEIATEAHRRQIPSLLFAATFSGESSRKGWIAGAITRKALHALDQIFCVCLEDLENLQDLGVRTATEIAGDTRFDQVLYRLQNPHLIKTELKPKDHSFKVLVLGSTWPQDEAILLPALKKWVTSGHRVIIAPHEVTPARVDELTKAFEKILNQKPDLYSQSSTWSSSVLLIDQIGCLQELYTWGDVGFVGGSFKDKVHSVMEPLCVGLPVLVGPCHRNNREALQFQNYLLKPGLFAVNVVQNSQDMAELLDLALDLQIPHPVILKKAHESAHSTEKILTWLNDHLSREHAPI